MNRESYLLDVIGALHPARRFSRRLYRWQQKCDQDADNGDDDQQFDERKRSRTIGWDVSS